MKFSSLFLLLLLPFCLSAEDAKWFIGIEGGTSGVEYTSIDTSVERKFGPAYGLKVGLYENNSRIYLGYSSTSNNSNKISAAASPYLALEGISNEFEVIAKSTAKFFFGVRLGATTADIDDITTTAFMGGLQTGLVFLLPANFEIEVAYRHEWTYKKELTDFNTATPYAGLNYKF